MEGSFYFFGIFKTKIGSTILLGRFGQRPGRACWVCLFRGATSSLEHPFWCKRELFSFD